jgi:hypothetical protein
VFPLLYHPCQRTNINLISEALRQALGGLRENDYVECRKNETYGERPADNRGGHYQKDEENASKEILENGAEGAESVADEIYQAARGLAEVVSEKVVEAVREAADR